MCIGKENYNINSLFESAQPQPLCPHLAHCDVWIHFKGQSKVFWQKRYCYSDKQHECARIQLQGTGASVPVNMLPNGHYLE